MQGISRGLTLAAALVAAGVLAGPAQAQSWPTRSITFVVPFPAGGGTDAYARPLAAVLDPQLGQRVIIENKAGAGGTVGASHAAKQKGDGYTFFIGAAHHAIAPAIYPKLDYNIETDFVPVGVIAQPPHVVVVNPQKVKATTLTEFIAHLKANPGKLNFASAGNGTTHHLAGELFQMLTGTKISHVPYRGAGPLMQDLVSGHVEMAFDGLGSSAPQIAGGKLRALAVTASARTPAIPNVPTSAEAGLKGFEVSTWYAMFAPKGTPPDVIAKMIGELRKAFGSDVVRAAWQKNGSAIPDLYGADFGKFVSSEVARWGKVVKDAGVKVN